jgi:hypothetical protein
MVLPGIVLKVRIPESACCNVRRIESHPIQVLGTNRDNQVHKKHYRDEINARYHEPTKSAIEKSLKHQSSPSWYYYSASSLTLRAYPGLNRR